MPITWGWALLGGNGIAYQDLLDIKKQYTVAFQKLIVSTLFHNVKLVQQVLSNHAHGFITRFEMALSLGCCHS